MWMPDRELLLERLERLAIVLDELMPQCAELVRDTIALLKEQEEAINYLTDATRQLNQHIKDLREYMTPYGMVADVKAYDELLNEQEDGLKHYDDGSVEP